MLIRFYCDDDSENHGVIQTLRDRGAEAVTSTECGMRGRPDADHLAYATEHGYVLCTSNRSDFNRLHKEWLNAGLSHSGIVLIVQQQYSIGELGRRLLSLRRTLSAEDMRNRIEYLNRWGISD